MNRHRSGASILAVLLLALSLSPLGGSAAARTCQAWGTPLPNVGGDRSLLHGVTVLSRCDVWAVGQRFAGGVWTTLIAHWDGRAWSIQPSPNPPGATQSSLAGVTALSPRNAWAVGTTYVGGDERTLVLHWDGSAWTLVKSPNPGAGGNSLADVAAVSADDVWAVGSRSDGDTRTLALHWNGTAWRAVPTPGVGGDEEVLVGVAAVAEGHVWAVGHRIPASNDRTLILRWNGAAWRVAKSPNPGTTQNYLMDVSATGPANAWAVGVREDGGAGTRTLALRWNGRAWRAVDSRHVAGATDSRFDGVVAVSPNEAWAVGDSYDGSARHPVVQRWDGSRWRLVPVEQLGTSSSLDAVAASSPGNVWAVGWYDDVTDQPYVLHCC